MKTLLCLVLGLVALLEVHAQSAVLDSAPHTLEFRTTNNLVVQRGISATNAPIFHPHLMRPETASMVTLSPGFRWKTNTVQVLDTEPIPQQRFYYTVQPGGVMSFIGAFDNPVEPLTRLRSGSQEFVDGHTCILTFAEEVKDGQVLWQFKPGFHVRTKPPKAMPPPLPLITRTNDSIIHSIITRNP